ncbi:unnamed protein product [Didymodactylos carnosus]|uniref:Uncharacterized protein n=1 Tax=Didymodactylos carnosus TaxID=1234261 RepID=A0A815F498_9BILA|nr:unnamed protein product [Didymodactylos carnosus]CAF1323390.1 unnamed protein product [Didymodactylos carnosus]CAF3994448.1 unnamed protein product [Didymodactylos carnosus]CAF4171203.1 unnamed protein product [Didymodactylos carnosus]
MSRYAYVWVELPDGHKTACTFLEELSLKLVIEHDGLDNFDADAEAEYLGLTLEAIHECVQPKSMTKTNKLWVMDLENFGRRYFCAVWNTSEIRESVIGQMREMEKQYEIKKKVTENIEQSKREKLHLLTQSQSLTNNEEILDNVEITDHEITCKEHSMSKDNDVNDNENSLTPDDYFFGRNGKDDDGIDIEDEETQMKKISTWRMWRNMKKKRSIEKTNRYINGNHNATCASNKDCRHRD